LHKDLLIIGDFNYPGIKWGDSIYGSSNIETRFSLTMLGLGFEQIVTKATHQSGSILDLVFTTTQNVVLDFEITPPFCDSDHAGVLFSTQLPVDGDHSSSDLLQNYNFAAINGGGFCAEFGSVDWLNEFRLCLSVDEMWKKFLDILNCAIVNHVPRRSCQSKGKCRWSAEVYKVSKLVKQLYKMYKRNPVDTVYSSWRNMSRVARRLKRKDRVLREMKVLKSGSTKQFWSFVNDHLSFKKPYHA